jgi:hypothetical protein
MLRRAMLCGSVVLCALSAMATGENPSYSDTWAREPWNRGGGGGSGGVGNGDGGKVIGNYRPPVRPGPPIFREHSTKEYAIPSGRCYTGVVIVPSRSSGSQRFTFNDGHCDFPVVVEGGQSFVLPFAKGWRPDCHASLTGDLCDGDFEVWAITDDGPMRLSYGCR